MKKDMKKAKKKEMKPAACGMGMPKMSVSMKVKKK